MDVHVRKERAGSDSFGNTWPEDGAVVQVPYEQAVILLAIKDGGFSVVDNPEPKPEPEPESPEEPAEVSEVAPEPEPDASPDEKPAPRRGGRPRKTVEEG